MSLILVGPVGRVKRGFWGRALEVYAEISLASFQAPPLANESSAAAANATARAPSIKLGTGKAIVGRLSLSAE